MTADKTSKDKTPLQRADLKGYFSRVVTKDGVLLEDFSLADWLKPLVKSHYSNEKFAHNITYSADSCLPVPPGPVVGPQGTAAPPGTSFVYLDVGAWIGSPQGKWGREDKGTGNYLKRDFGIVCGPLVMLCSFSSAYPKGHCDAWKTHDKSSRLFTSVAALLDTLSRAVHSSELGTAVVRDLMVPSSFMPLLEKDYLIHVIMGDMHIPVLDDVSQSEGKSFDWEPARTHFVSPGVPRQNRLDELAVAQAEADPTRVPRLGRVDVRSLEEMVATYVGPGADGAELVSRLIAVSGTKAKAAYHGSPLMAKIVTLNNDTGGLLHDTMSAADARRWWEFYREGVPKHGVGIRPADIFENAGTDFAEFAKRLAAYAAKSNDDDELVPVKFFQLGDMLDFWVGFGCHYEPAPNVDQPVSAVSQWGQGMVRHWTFNLFGKTEQGRGVARAIEHMEAKDLEPVYLYGNHDNYLGHMTGLKYPSEQSGKPNELAARRGFYSGRGVFMEHGHQWEESNADSAAMIPYVSTKVMGTKAPLGLLVTQAAFIRPAAIRKIEGEAAGLVASFDGGLGQRMEQLKGAVNRFVSSSFGFYCYVMGHTHVACLCRVTVAQSSDQKKRARARMEQSTTAQITITVDGKDFGKDFDEFKYVERDTGVVAVKWTGMLGDSEDEWLALEQKYSKPLCFDRAVKGRAAMTGGGESGSKTFPNLPPGAYQARYYLTQEAVRRFRSSFNTLVVVGLSIEGDEDHVEGIDFYVDEETRKFKRPVVLRWGFDPNGFDRTQAWFGLYRPGEKDDHVSVIVTSQPTAMQQPRRMPQKNLRPSRLFCDIAKEYTWGSYKLTDAHPWPWDASMDPHQEWQIRAFMDFERKKKIGQVEFVVHKVEHVKKPRRK